MTFRIIYVLFPLGATQDGFGAGRGQNLGTDRGKKQEIWFSPLVIKATSTFTVEAKKNQHILRSPCMRSQPLNIRTISHDIRNMKACPASVQNPAGLTMLPRPSLQTTEMLDLCHRRNCSYDTWLKTPKDQQMSHLHRLVRLKPFLSFKAFFFLV